MKCGWDKTRHLIKYTQAELNLWFTQQQLNISQKGIVGQKANRKNTDLVLRLRLDRQSPLTKHGQSADKPLSFTDCECFIVAGKTDS